MTSMGIRTIPTQKDSKYVNQNSGVRIEALDGLGRKIQYFGIIEEIWELDYGRDITVALF